LRLERRDRRRRRRAADVLRQRLGQPEEAHLALVGELLHRADRLLDRRLRIDAVLLVEVDHVDPEPAQARLARLLHILGASVDAGSVELRHPHAAEADRRDLELAEPACLHATYPNRRRYRKNSPGTRASRRRALCGRAGYSSSASTWSPPRTNAFTTWPSLIP